MVRALASATLSVTCVLAVACGDASHPGDAQAWLATDTTDGVTIQDLGWGWDRPITKDLCPPAATKLGGANMTIAGESLRAIVTDPDVAIRADAKACTSCHAWATDITRTDFCSHVPAFVALPTAKDDGTDPVSAKPQLLKDLLSKWYAVACPQ